MNESERERLNNLNAELMVANADYEDLKKRLLKLGKRIFDFKVKIDDRINGGTK